MRPLPSERLYLCKWFLEPRSNYLANTTNGSIAVESPGQFMRVLVNLWASWKLKELEVPEDVANMMLGYDYCSRCEVFMDWKNFGDGRLCPACSAAEKLLAMETKHATD
jgi:hypothetical protein